MNIIYLFIYEINHNIKYRELKLYCEEVGKPCSMGE